jgi:hypothetical protein
MTYKYSFKWAYIELVVALAMTVAVYMGLKPEWWGWLLFSPLFLYLVFEGVRKVTYSLTVDGDLITIGGLKPAQYSASKITAINIWDAKGGRIAVVTFDDGNRFNFPSRLEGFNDLVNFFKSKANLP